MATASLPDSTARTSHLDIGLLLLRVVLAVIFIAHGYQKMAVMGMGAVGQAFASMGIPMGQIAGPVIALLECFGGFALLLGFLTRWVALLFVCDMLGAILFVHAKNGFFMPTGAEFAIINCAAALTLALTGPGAYSIDAMMRRRTP